MYERSPINNGCSVFCNTVLIDSGKDGGFAMDEAAELCPLICFSVLRGRSIAIQSQYTSLFTVSPQKIYVSITFYDHFSSYCHRWGHWKGWRQKNRSYGSFLNSLCVFLCNCPSVWQTWQLWVSWCGATSPRRSSWRASVRRSPTSCPTAQPQMGPLLCSSKSSTGPCLTSASAATASLTPRWKR